LEKDSKSNKYLDPMFSFPLAYGIDFLVITFKAKEIMGIFLDSFSIEKNFN